MPDFMELFLVKCCLIVEVPHVRFEVFMSLEIELVVFWVVVTFSMVVGFRCF